MKAEQTKRKNSDSSLLKKAKLSLIGKSIPIEKYKFKIVTLRNKSDNFKDKNYKMYNLYFFDKKRTELCDIKIENTMNFLRLFIENMKKYDPSNIERRNENDSFVKAGKHNKQQKMIRK